MARPLLLALLLGVAGVAGVAACGDAKPTGPAIVAGAPAGSVTDLHGTVTAARGEVRRTLVAGDAVAGDDVIETGVDSRVTIVLAHNQVPFSLGPERSQQVGTSPAWSAARGTSVAVTSTDRSGAAGRHAEREAADTMASAPGAATALTAPPPLAAPSDPAPSAQPAPPPPVAAAMVADEPPPPKPARSPGARRSAAEDLAPPPPPPPPDVAAADVAVTTAAETGVPDRRRKIVGQLGRGEPVGDLGVDADREAPLGGAPRRLVASIEPVVISGGLAAADVLGKVRSRGLLLRECAGPAPAATKFALTLTIAPTGAVTAAATGGAPDVHACLARQLGALKFPSAPTSTSARLTLALLPR